MSWASSFALSAGAPAIAPGFTLDLMAKHSLDFWLTSEDLPDPNNRVTLDKQGNIVLSYKPNNLEPHKRLQAKLQELMKQQTKCDVHGHDCHQGLFARSLYLGQRIPLAGVVLCALFVYAALRSRFDWWASAAGAIAVISHPIIVRQAFEARFYGPWLFFVALYAWSLTQPRRWVQAVAAVCVVSIHWFGVISLGLIITAFPAARAGATFHAINNNG